MNNIQEQNKHYFSKTGLQALKSDIELVFAIGAEIKLLKKGKRFLGCLNLPRFCRQTGSLNI